MTKVSSKYTNMVKSFLFDLRRKKCSDHIKSIFPIFDWLPAYKLSYFVNDFVAGITVGIYNVPQAMAYAILAGVPPIIGLYSSFFPPLLYAIFGTSMQVSVGMFSVTALMVGSVNDRLSLKNSTVSEEASEFNDLHSVQVVTAMTFTIALVLIVMSILRLHFVVDYMSDELVSGYTTGAACHVVATQLPKIFGLNIPRRTGLFKLYYILKDIILSIKSTNLPDLFTSVVCIAFLHVGKWYINPKVKLRSRVLLPFELFAIVIATVLSGLLDVQRRYKMEIVSSIPAGFPVPALPKFSLISDVFFDAIVTAVVIFAISISICKVFEEKRSNVINASQELFALGAVEFLISFFLCHPACGSLTRTVINAHCGAQTQLSNVISATLMAVSIMWAAQLLTALPKCVLSAIIVVALQTMFLQVQEVKKLWKVSKADMFIWLVGFLATVVWDVSQGLGIAVAFALLTVIFRSQWPKAGRVESTETTSFFEGTACRRTSTDSTNLGTYVVYRFNCSLLFLNVKCFKKKIYKLVEESCNSRNLAKRNEAIREMENGSDTREECLSQFLILDASGFSDIDHQGVKCLKEVAVELREKRIELLLASVTVHVLKRCKLCGIQEFIPLTNIFPSVQHAIDYATGKGMVLHCQSDGDNNGGLVWDEKF